MYISNKHDWDCGPTALANLVVWLGKTKRPSMIRNRMIDALGTDENGTYDEDMEKEIEELSRVHGFYYKKIKKINHSKLIDEMEEGSAIILAHIEHFGEWHYSFFFMSRGGIIGVNVYTDIENPVFKFKTTSTFKLLCSKGDSQEKPSAWVIRP